MMEHDANDLLCTLKSISEAFYLAGWMEGLEYSLWHYVILWEAGELTFPYGMGKIDPDLIEKLHDLAHKCDGWWCWQAETGETFMPLKDWKARFWNAWGKKSFKRWENRPDAERKG